MTPDPHTDPLAPLIDAITDYADDGHASHDVNEDELIWVTPREAIEAIRPIVEPLMQDKAALVEALTKLRDATAHYIHNGYGYDRIKAAQAHAEALLQRLTGASPVTEER